MTRAGCRCRTAWWAPGVKFERVRRIALLSMPVSLAPPANGHGALRRHSVATGYLVGTLDRFNNAKRAEEHDRVKHGLGGKP